MYAATTVYSRKLSYLSLTTMKRTIVYTLSSEKPDICGGLENGGFMMKTKVLSEIDPLAVGLLK